MESNFYEILEIHKDATEKSIDRAYRIARATYQPASPATYSIFSDDENSDILRRIEEAYTILSDARLRREYDARLRRESNPEPERPRTPLGPPAPAALRLPEEPPPRAESPEGPPAQTPEPIPSPPLAPVQADAEAPRELGPEPAGRPRAGRYDGRALRQMRINLDIELEEIASRTKISERYLRLIEADSYPELPAPVYLKGFLRELAKALRLEPGIVVAGYMKRYEESVGRG